MADPFLIVFAGAPGVGKSTLARALARELASAYLDKDTIKDVALALGREMQVGDIGKLAGALSYMLLVPLARDNLTVGTSVVIDSPAGYRGFQDAIEELVRSVKPSFKLIECITTDDALLREPVEQRAAGLSGHRVHDVDAYQQARERMERLSGSRLVVDTAEAVQINLKKIMGALGAPALGATDQAAPAAPAPAAPAPGSDKREEP